MCLKTIRKVACSMLFVVLTMLSYTAVVQATENAKNPCAQNTCAQNPCAQNPCAQNPCAQNPCAQNPCAQNPCAQQPCAQQPCAQQPCAQQPCAQQPCAQQPCAQQPCAQQPCAQQPCAQQPCAQQPCAQQPCAQNPCAQQPCAQNPCAQKPAASMKIDSKLVVRPEGTKMYKGRRSRLIKLGKKLWRDKSLSTNGMACYTCHAKNTNFNPTFAKPYPHPVAMAKARVGLEKIAADEMVQLCMIVPMASKPLAWDSKELAALTTYVERVVQKEYKKSMR